MNQIVNIVGAGLAGSEAAYQLAKRGIPVRLYEMRPKKSTEAHKTDQFAELVCSNSLRADTLENAVGILKEEMRLLDSLIIKVAEQTQVPAGGALAVDREGFSRTITDTLKQLDLIEIIHDEVTEIPGGHTIIASGPLTSEPLSQAIKEILGNDYFYFFDAAAPIIDRETINMDRAYLKSRYDKGEAAYINCPMTEEEYKTFYEALITAECAEIKEFEKEVYFEGCMPVEVMAKRGEQTLLFGPLKPVGLEDPHTGQTPHAVVQLRQDNAAATMYNIVGFQTHLKFPEQRRVFRLIPGLENAEFLRYGVMHRNSFINSPKFLLPTYQTKQREDLFFAGQMTGVEGYVESAASGLYAAINMAKLIAGEKLVVFPRETIIGSMSHYITSTDPNGFQPMNANFGLVSELGFRHKKKERKALYGTRAIEVMKDYINRFEL
jgi:methylenetetrahydrofolate--tRNA-(uracil-5-)-methyltransferase